ncbi:hypothetical protein ALDI51_15510 [Alicycliphilus denitrificans]|uniref:amidohydrolase family protein n=1 Tax=Alicycliphilus denitrificans TaxID=179636 RepID=UPI0019157348|nr:amidohydrolase family protein [Alicycliphilus denitrificans]BCN38232.1 hypothetical protein ALDI51_15510 [Alicycliphilus denitrificans]
MYEGPIIDAHQHLWNYDMGKHRWLGQAQSSLNIVGDSRYLERSYLPFDFAQDNAGCRVVGSVHIEAHWDRSTDGIEETAWLETLCRPSMVADRYVVWTELTRPGADERLAAHRSCSSRVTGVRESIREHADSAYSYAGSANWRSPVWQSGVAILEKVGLVLELLIYAQQGEVVAELARLFPRLTIVVNHSASPIGTGDPARSLFRLGIEAMARQPNIYLKASNFFRYSDDLDFKQCLEQIARPCVEVFGPERMLFASDFPVASKWTSYANLVHSLKGLLSGYTAEQQRDYFFATANRLYGFGLPPN